MFDISPNKLTQLPDNQEFKSYRAVTDPLPKQVFGRWLVAFLAVGTGLLFCPWTQNIQTEGRVTTLRPGQRPHGEIGYHALRVGDNPGEHTIVFGLLGETLEIAVRASNRDCYAHGALAAAKFLAGKKAGLYNMNDVLGL